MLLLQECVRGALKNKTILLVTHQVDFLHNVDLIVVSSQSIFFFLFIFASLVFEETIISIYMYD